VDARLHNIQEIEALELHSWS